MKDITNEQYVHLESKYYRGTVGEHIRHILDHYQCLLDGWNDKIDYDARNRNKEIEINRTAAILKIEDLISRLHQIVSESKTLEMNVPVKSNTAEKDSDTPWSSSSHRRELQFLVGHTVHHYALIAIILRIQQIPVPNTFGVAPSTLSHLAENDETDKNKAMG